MWELRRERVAATLKKSHVGSLSCLVFSKTDKFLAGISSGDENTWVCWDWSTSTLVGSGGVPAGVGSVCFSADGRHVVTSGLRHVRYWALPEPSKASSKVACCHFTLRQCCMSACRENIPCHSTGVRARSGRCPTPIFCLLLSKRVHWSRGGWRGLRHHGRCSVMPVQPWERCGQSLDAKQVGGSYLLRCLCRGRDRKGVLRLVLKYGGQVVVARCHVVLSLTWCFPSPFPGPFPPSCAIPLCAVLCCAVLSCVVQYVAVACAEGVVRLFRPTTLAHVATLPLPGPLPPFLPPPPHEGGQEEGTTGRDVPAGANDVGAGVAPASGGTWGPVAGEGVEGQQAGVMFPDARCVRVSCDSSVAVHAIFPPLLPPFWCVHTPFLRSAYSRAHTITRICSTLQHSTSRNLHHNY